MADSMFVPIIYKCGHSINIVSPGEADPNSKIGDEFLETGEPVRPAWADKCWYCGDLWKTKVPDSVTEELRKAKYGESVQTPAAA